MILDESSDGMPDNARQMGQDVYSRFGTSESTLDISKTFLLAQAEKDGFKFYKILGFRSLAELAHKMKPTALKNAKHFGWLGRYDIYVW